MTHTLRSEGHDASEDGTGRGVPLVAATLRSRQSGKGVSMPGRGGEDDANLVTDRYGVRRLTPRECERLQGFDDDWTCWAADGKEISDSARYRMLGNAVSVPVSEWIGKRIMEVVKTGRLPAPLRSQVAQIGKIEE